MTQPDLFDRQVFGEKFTRTGTSIVPPTREELAKAARDRGMRRAADHAGKDGRTRRSASCGAMRASYRTMMAEDCRAMAEANGLAEPPNQESVGPGHATSGARRQSSWLMGTRRRSRRTFSPKVCWRSLV